MSRDVIQSKKILLFADGPNIDEINNDYKIGVMGTHSIHLYSKKMVQKTILITVKRF